MKRKNLNILMIGMLVAVLSLGSLATAEEPAPPVQCGQGLGMGSGGRPMQMGLGHGRMGPRGPHGSSMMCKMKEELGLTDEQVEQIKESRTANAEQIKAVMEVIKQKKEALNEAVKAGAAENAIRAAADELGNALGNKAVLDAAKTTGMKQILTAEQYEKSQAIHEEMQSKKEQKKQARPRTSKTRRSQKRPMGQQMGAQGQQGLRGTKGPQTGRQGQQGLRGPRGAMDPEAAFEKMDANDDGSISIEEFTAAKENFKSRRTNRKRRPQPETEN